MVSAVSVMAETTLTASVDRNKIYESDTLNLIIMGEIEMDFSLGGIMNFGRNQLEAPNTDALSKDFEILDQKQSYNMQSMNGATTAQVTWPTLEEAINGSVVVIICVVFLMAFMAGTDWVLGRVATTILLGRG